MGADGQLAALVLADGRLPVGGHAQSGGLEPGLAAGLAPQQIPDYIRGRLRTVGLVEAATAVLARRAAAAPDAVASLSRIGDAYLARTPSAPLRIVSEQVGRGMARLARVLWADAGPVAALHELAAPPRPVALGILAALGGLDDAQTARTSLYDDAQTVASAATKLVPIDPVEPVRWLLTCGATLEEMVERAVAVTGPDDLPASAAPQAEQWSLDHAARERRIFHA
ncbi:urease accessory protein UreF [Brachybacterium hainanense]|uniref:Urease accessory protein UreF n=1 Tax=Brachybacterium hainanense TaxID=1541174 RepID=A0ABV6RCJ0_9MICO